MSINRRFIVFLAGSFLASFGGWINFLAILNIATWRFKATPFDLVLLSAALLLPSVMLTKNVGRLCGRHAGSVVMIAALAVTLGTTATLLYVDHLATFLLVVAIKSAALGFVDPAELRYVTTSLDESQHDRAFRLLTLAQNVAKIAAPAAGALFGAWAGDDRTMLLSIAIIALAIVALLLSATRQQPSHAERAQVQANVSVDIRGAIAPLLWCAGISLAMSAAVNNQFPLMLKTHGFSEAVLGLLVSCSAVGGVLGSALPSLAPMKRRDANVSIRSFVAPALTSSCVFIAISGIFRMPIYPAHFLLAIAFFVTGLVGARFRIGCRIYIARHLADQVAQAGATLQSVGMLTQFIAPCMGAILTSYLPPDDVFFALGTVAAIGLVSVSLVFSRTRLVDESPFAIEERVPE